MLGTRVVESSKWKKSTLHLNKEKIFVYFGHDCVLVGLGCWTLHEACGIVHSLEAGL